MSVFIYDPPQEPFLNILYEDDFIVVCDKPSGLLSVPGRLLEHQDSLIYRIRQTTKDAQAVHRLDMDTSGIMVVAKDSQTAGLLGKQFISHDAKKAYIAKVLGLIEKSGSIDAPLRCDWENRPLQIVDYKQGKPSLTLFERISSDDNSSIVKLLPKTGRSHQLRVHLASIGHPIAGDRFYAKGEALKLSSRLCLHAAFLEFKHPYTNEVMLFSTKASFAKDVDPSAWIV